MRVLLNTIHNAHFTCERSKSHPRRALARELCSPEQLSHEVFRTFAGKNPPLCPKVSHDSTDKTKLNEFGVEFASLRHPSSFAYCSLMPPTASFKAVCLRQCKRKFRSQQFEGKPSTEDARRETEKTPKEQPQTPKKGSLHHKLSLGFEPLENSPPPVPRPLDVLNSELPHTVVEPADIVVGVKPADLTVQL